jgi:copper chaperone CopZ
MAEQTHLITLAVSGMTCGHCEIAVERLIRGCVGVESVRANHASALATLTSRGPLDLNALNAKMHDEGYAASLATKHDRTNLARSGVEAAGAIAVVLAIVLLARHFHLLPQGINVSENMTLGFVFVIGLVASVSSCMAVTGGLLVALAAKYNEATTNVSAARRFLPHVFFNAGRIIAYTGFGALIGLAGSASIENQANWLFRCNRDLIGLTGTIPVGN